MKASPPRHGLARVLSKRGLCSRTQAAQWIAQGRVRVDGRVIRDPEFPITADGRQRIAIDGDEADQAPARFYLMLNKPRGLVTTARDDRGRETVYRCFDGARIDGTQVDGAQVGGAQVEGRPFPWVAPVGRLDKASEGLLLFCNDPAWAARITDPEHGPSKTYHVQVDAQPGPELLVALEAGVDCEGECLRARQARVLRVGERNAWLEIVLDEGRNRQIRRLLAAFDIAVLRLVRVAIGPLVLGGLAKGQWRRLSDEEVGALRA